LPIGNVLNTVKKQFEDMQRNDSEQFKKWQEFYFKNWMEIILAGNMLKQALTKYRQKASNAVEESYAFLDLLPNVQEYILPNNIILTQN
jgi:hypothetical protein